jgi:hypothetical protein
MKELKSVFTLKTASIFTIALVLTVSSCKKDNELVLTSNDTQNINSETVSDSFSDDAQDMSIIAISNVNPNQFAGGRVDGGRTQGSSPVNPIVAWRTLDDRLKCAEITINPTNALGASPKGTITINFDANTSCADARGVTRKGKIVIEYSGARFSVDSYIKTTFVGYFRNDAKVDGVHLLTNVTPTNPSFPRFSVAITGGKITFGDGKTITREQSFVREWQRAINPLEDKWVILANLSSASGANKNNVSYTMLVTKDIVYSRACVASNVFIAVSGTKQFIVEGKTYSVDYGDGNCDNEITVSVGGLTKTITVNKDGN